MLSPPRGSVVEAMVQLQYLWVTDDHCSRFMTQRASVAVRKGRLEGGGEGGSIHVNLGLLNPNPSPVPSPLSLSSTRANTGCAYAMVAADVTAAASCGSPFAWDSFFSAEHTTLGIRSAGRPAQDVDPPHPLFASNQT